jgi:hypothetical protein
MADRGVREVFQRQGEGGRNGTGKMILWAIKWERKATWEKKLTELKISNI